MGSYWFSVLRVLFCLPLFFVLCPLLNASLLVVGVVCFALFAFVLCLVSTVVCFVLFAFVLCLVPTVACVFIGLPLIKKLTGKSIFVQLKKFSFDSEFIDMTVLTDCLAHDLLLQGIADVEKCMQNVYIMSGRDFV
jgi:hypothetical protein